MLLMVFLPQKPMVCFTNINKAGLELTAPATNDDDRKWSPSWKGPFKVARVVPGNSYLVESMKGILLPRALDGRYLKKFYLSVWQEA